MPANPVEAAFQLQKEKAAGISFYDARSLKLYQAIIMEIIFDNQPFAIVDRKGNNAGLHLTCSWYAIN